MKEKGGGKKKKNIVFEVQKQENKNTVVSDGFKTIFSFSRSRFFLDNEGVMAGDGDIAVMSSDEISSSLDYEMK